MTLKAITLYQPLATLAVLGAKPWETRSYRIHHRGPLAIHAGQRMWKAGDYSADRWELIRLALQRFGIQLEACAYCGDRYRLPFGAILGVVDVVDVQPAPAVMEMLVDTGAKGNGDVTLNALDALAFGDYRDGRWAWKLENPFRLSTPHTTRGSMGLWNVPPATAKSILAERSAR